MNWKTFWNTSPQVSDPDLCRQVGRTYRRVPYSDRQLDAVTTRVLALLEPRPGARLLDLACGNGLITSRLRPRFESVVATDFSRPLIDTARGRFAASNISFDVGDAIDLDGVNGQFDCVHLGAALQHLDQRQAGRMLRRLHDVVRPDGRVVLSDVADGDRVWSFYRGIGGRIRYAAGILTSRPVIGTWWTPAALEHVAAEAGWTCSIQYQDQDLPNHFFRYDAVLTRKTQAAGPR